MVRCGGSALDLVRAAHSVTSPSPAAAARNPRRDVQTPRPHWLATTPRRDRAMSHLTASLAHRTRPRRTPCTRAGRARGKRPFTVRLPLYMIHLPVIASPSSCFHGIRRRKDDVRIASRRARSDRVLVAPLRSHRSVLFGPAPGRAVSPLAERDLGSYPPWKQLGSRARAGRARPR